MNIVIDTNVIASAVFFGGKPGYLLSQVMIGHHHAYASKEIVEEYRETVEYLHNKYSGKPMNPALNMVLRKIKLIETNTRIDVCRDPDDNKFIECAVDAQCFYIVSGDKDLLTIKQYNGIRIMTVSEFIEMAEQ